jgi:hypothetical protein
MARYKADAIDECCEEMLGHTNWAYADTMPRSEMKWHEKNNSIYRVVVFFNHESKEE